jgi:hypothetical protein
MLRRWIAGLLLLTILPWANTLTWSGPSHHHLPPLAASSGPSPHQDHANVKGHACCPGFKGPEILVAAQSTIPCGGQHRCCFSQAPEAPPGLPVKAGNPQWEGRVSAVVTAFDPQRNRNTPVAWDAADTVPPYSSFSTILRI